MLMQVVKYSNYCAWRGRAVGYWLRQHATNWQDAGSIASCVIGIFQ